MTIALVRPARPALTAGERLQILCEAALAGGHHVAAHGDPHLLTALAGRIAHGRPLVTVTGPPPTPGRLARALEQAHGGVLRLDLTHPWPDGLAVTVRGVLDAKALTLTRGGVSRTFPADVRLLLTIPVPVPDCGAAPHLIWPALALRCTLFARGLTAENVAALRPRAELLERAAALSRARLASLPDADLNEDLPDAWVRVSDLPPGPARERLERALRVGLISRDEARDVVRLMLTLTDLYGGVFSTNLHLACDVKGIPA